jgi:LysR family hydrogen peroxide-inducible transcriptional activator
MELHEIRYFLAVARALNFTRAAEQCHVTQPALTRAIQKIEAELGGPLFLRERGRTRLTELGRLMQPHFEEVLARTHAARETAERFLKLEDTELRLGVMCTIGPMRFIGFLNRFRADHPGVALSLIERPATPLKQALLDSEIDVAVMACPQGFDDPLRAEKLYAERFVVACAVGHPFARRNALVWPDMNGETYLQRINCEYNDVLGAIGAQQNVRVHESFRSEREDWIQTMVAAGMGVCLVPEFTATHQGVALRLLTQPEVVREVALVTVAGRRWTPPVARFVAALRRYDWPAAEGAIPSGSAAAGAAIQRARPAATTSAAPTPTTAAVQPSDS